VPQPALAPRARKIRERRLQAAIFVLRRAKAADEGLEVGRSGRRADHLRAIELGGVHEQLRIHIGGLEPTGGEIRGELDQAQAEPEFERGEIGGIGGIEELGDRRGAVVLGVQTVLVRRGENRGQRAGARGGGVLGDPKRPHLPLPIEAPEQREILRILLARRNARAGLKLPEDLRGARCALPVGGGDQSDGRARPDGGHGRQGAPPRRRRAYTVLRYHAYSVGVTMSPKRSRSAARHTRYRRQKASPR
jgi:hypothetical protein